MTLGEIDPHVLEDIDMMLMTFRVFENVPASLVKGIGVKDRLEHKTALLSSSISIELTTTTENT